MPRIHSTRSAASSSMLCVPALEAMCSFCSQDRESMPFAYRIHRFVGADSIDPPSVLGTRGSKRRDSIRLINVAGENLVLSALIDRHDLNEEMYRYGFSRSVPGQLDVKCARLRLDRGSIQRCGWANRQQCSLGNGRIRRCQQHCLQGEGQQEGCEAGHSDNRSPAQLEPRAISIVPGRGCPAALVNLTSLASPYSPCRRRTRSVAALSSWVK